MLGVETGLWLAKQRLGRMSGVEVQPHTPFGYARAQLHGSAPSEVTWHRSEPQNSMDVYTDTIMNHKRRSFTHIWQQGKRFWNEYTAVSRTNKVSFGLWFWLRWDSLVEQKELLRMSQKHSSISNMKPFHSAQYTNYYLPNLIQIMVFPQRGSVMWQQTTQRSFLRNKLAVSFFKKIWLSYKPLGRNLHTEPNRKKKKRWKKSVEKTDDAAQAKNRNNTCGA